MTYTERSLNRNRTRQEESVMLISGWVLLGLEQRIKVPERALNKVIGGHLREPTDSKQQHEKYLH